MDLRERLAEYAHAARAGWTNNLFSKCTPGLDGMEIVPKWAVERWRRQAETPYAELPEEDKDKDREQADKMLAIVDEERPAQLQSQMIINPTAVDDGAAPLLAHPRVGEDLLRSRDRRIKALIKALREAEADRADLQATFDLQQTHLEKATKLWQRETGKDSQPDLGALLEWLMERIESLERECDTWDRRSHKFELERDSLQAVVDEAEVILTRSFMLTPLTLHLLKSKHLSQAPPPVSPDTSEPACSCGNLNGGSIDFGSCDCTACEARRVAVDRKMEQEMLRALREESGGTRIPGSGAPISGGGAA